MKGRGEVEARRNLIPRRSFVMAPLALGVGTHAFGQNGHFEEIRARNYSVRVGVDDARLAEDNSPTSVSQLFEISKDLGLTHVDIHISPITNAGGRNAFLIGQKIRQIEEQMRRHSLTYTLNVEAPNFRESAEITPGVNEFEHPRGAPPLGPAHRVVEAYLASRCHHPPGVPGVGVR